MSLFAKNADGSLKRLSVVTDTPRNPAQPLRQRLRR